MRRRKIITVMYCVCLAGTGYAQQENLLLQNKALLKALTGFEEVSEINEDYIQFKTKETGLKVNFCFGVAFRKNGKIIYPADAKISWWMEPKGKYIILTKGNNLAQLKYGMIDSTGHVVLDFEYSKIGNVVMPIPDSLIIVQQGEKFGVFNTNTATLSAIKYNGGALLNDGYGYHEGGGSEMRKAIYTQLGLSNYNPPYPLQQEYSKNATINKEKENEQYLVSETGKRISKNYQLIQQLYSYYNPLFFTAYAYQQYKYVLLDETGNEISELDTPLPSGNEYYVKLNQTQFYFIATKKIVTIPKGYYEYVTCYAKDGFLGFKETGWSSNTDKKPGKKLFVDKYGNLLTQDEL